MMRRSRRTSPASPDAPLQSLEQRHQVLLQELGDIGLVLRGTIGKRMMRCGQSRCRCQTDPAARHGPYYLWTRKVSAKTVTLRLEATQATRLQQWTKNMRRLDRLVKALQKLGLRAADAVRSPK